MSSGILYRYVPDADTEEAQLVVPECARQKILEEYHDSPTSGHYSYERTLNKISQRYFWPRMRQQIKDYVRNCTECQKYKPTNSKPAKLLKTPVAQQRFEVVAIDLFGPLPVSKEGYQWIFICEDISTRWVELFPLVYAIAEACAKCFIDEVVLRYGTPRRVILPSTSESCGKKE